MRVGHVLVIRRWPLARPPRKTPRAISAHRRKRIESIQKNAQGGEHPRKRNKDIEKCKGRRAPTNAQIVAGKTPRAHGGAQRTRGARARAPSSLAAPGARQDQPEKRRERWTHRRKRLEHIKTNAESGEHRRKRKAYIEKCTERKAPTKTETSRKNTESARRSKTHARRARTFELG